jgi:hypothetical protein
VVIQHKFLPYMDLDLEDARLNMPPPHGDEEVKDIWIRLDREAQEQVGSYAAPGHLRAAQNVWRGCLGRGLVCATESLVKDIWIRLDREAQEQVGWWLWCRADCLYAAPGHSPAAQSVWRGVGGSIIYGERWG